MSLLGVKMGPRHGMKGTPTYHSWRAMKSRCLNPKDPAFFNYGGRGIDVHAPWLDFRCFLADMGVRPDDRELDRIDVNGGYSPENCRWATRKQNSVNKRGTVRLTAFGVTQPLTEAARAHGVHIDTVRYRMRVSGMSAEDALSVPTGSVVVDRREKARNAKNAKLFDFGGKKLLLVEIAPQVGIPYAVLCKRLETHDFEKSINTPYKPNRRTNANA